MDGENNNPNNAQNATGQNNNTAGTSAINNSTGTGTNPVQNAGIDYNKIQEIIDGRNAKTEDAVLKSYFQKQGLSEDEMQSAIENFKTSKAQKALEQNQNAVNLQNENNALKAKVQKMQIESKATDIALGLGVDAKTVPYLIKMADFSNAVGSDGKIVEESIKTALNDILEALPQLKGQVQNNDAGFQKIGGANENNQTGLEDALKEIFS